MENKNTNYRTLTTKLRRISAGSLALALAAMQVVPAYATVDNSVTASGTAPGGAPVTATVGASVGVDTAVPGITLVKTASFAVPATDDPDGDGKGDQADKITYTYTVTNTGNVTVNDVGIADIHEGAVALSALVVPTVVTTDAGSAPAGTLGDSSDATGDFTWDVLGPGDTITFQATYIVQVADIMGAGGGAVPDGDIDNSATASANYNNTSASTVVPVSSVSATSMPLDITNAITIAKTANPSTNVAAGTTVTYTYVVTNTGNTIVSNVELHDTHNGVLDALTPAFSSFTTDTGSAMGSGLTANTIVTFRPGNVAEFTATYIVTQADVDNRQ